MKVHWWFHLGVGCALLLGAGVCSQMLWATDDEPSAAGDAAASSSKRSRSTRTTAGKSEQAKQQVDEKLLSQKLDHILENQEKILKRIDDVMAELQIVKVRATVR